MTSALNPSQMRLQPSPPAGCSSGRGRARELPFLSVLSPARTQFPLVALQPCPPCTALPGRRAPRRARVRRFLFRCQSERNDKAKPEKQHDDTPDPSSE